MITNIAPEERYYYDTYCTLNFASKSKKIVNNAQTRESTGECGKEMSKNSVIALDLEIYLNHQKMSVG